MRAPSPRALCLVLWEPMRLSVLALLKLRGDGYSVKPYVPTLKVASNTWQTVVKVWDG